MSELRAAVLFAFAAAAAACSSPAPSSSASTSAAASSGDRTPPRGCSDVTFDLAEVDAHPKFHVCWQTNSDWRRTRDPMNWWISNAGYVGQPVDVDIIHVDNHEVVVDAKVNAPGQGGDDVLWSSSWDIDWLDTYVMVCVPGADPANHDDQDHRCTFKDLSAGGEFTKQLEQFFANGA